MKYDQFSRWTVSFLEKIMDCFGFIFGPNRKRTDGSNLTICQLSLHLYLLLCNITFY